jgi:hypothetical protein
MKISTVLYVLSDKLGMCFDDAVFYRFTVGEG